MPIFKTVLVLFPTFSNAVLNFAIVEYKLHEVTFNKERVCNFLEEGHSDMSEKGQDCA